MLVIWIQFHLDTRHDRKRQGRSVDEALLGPRGLLKMDRHQMHPLLALSIMQLDATHRRNTSLGIAVSGQGNRPTRMQSEESWQPKLNKLNPDSAARPWNGLRQDPASKRLILTAESQFHHLRAGARGSDTCEVTCTIMVAHMKTNTQIGRNNPSARLDVCLYIIIGHGEERYQGLARHVSF